MTKLIKRWKNQEEENKIFEDVIQGEIQLEYNFAKKIKLEGGGDEPNSENIHHFYSKQTDRTTYRSASQQPFPFFTKDIARGLAERPYLSSRIEPIVN